jgi:hypothetical protein
VNEDRPASARASRSAFERWFGPLSSTLGVALGLVGVYVAVAPMLGHWDALGGHDWDQMAGHRYLMVKSLREFGQFPFWDPYTCGGHPSWGGIESGTTIVSPWFPVYMLLKLPIALRIETIGTTLLSFAGTWLLAGRVTKHAALRLFVCAVFVVNGRWALQVAAGHTWHLYYAWMPWTLYFLDRAFDEERPLRPIVGAGVTFALMIYNGGIYPLPQTAFVASIYALFLSVARRSLRPVAAVAASGVLGICLSSPKLLPVVEALARFPRPTDSPETMDLRGLVLLLIEREQVFNGPGPTKVSHWGWHEWGMYIGVVPCAAILLALVLARGPKENALKWTGIVAVLLAFGSFHKDAPWPLLRMLPVFSSQHVPSRWLYPAVLLFGVVVAAVGTRWLARTGRARPWLELALLGLAGWIAIDVGRESSRSTKSAFWMTKPEVTVAAQFQQHAKVPPQLHYPVRDWAPPALPPMLANVGVIDCVSFPGLTIVARDNQGKAPGLGAKGREDPGYRGEVFLLSGTGKAEYTRWSPNQLEVKLTGATPGDRVVVNQNWESGWTANGKRALNDEDRIAAVVAEPDQTILFRYRPRLFGWGLLSCVMSMLTVAAIAWRGRWIPLISRYLPKRRVEEPPPATS